jgi:hypothetical protein
MSGVSIIRTILVANAPVLAIVPAARIMAGDIPLNTVLPAISIMQISGIPRLTVAMTEPNRMQTDRIQVSAILKGPHGAPPGLGYPGVKSLLALVRAALPNRNGTVAGFSLDSILPDTIGPDLQDEASQIFSQSQDFIVKWRVA